MAQVRHPGAAREQRHEVHPHAHHHTQRGLCMSNQRCKSPASHHTTSPMTPLATNTRVNSRPQPGRGTSTCAARSPRYSKAELVHAEMPVDSARKACGACTSLK